MKRKLWIGCCILLICLTVSYAAFAQTQEEWDLSCRYKLSKSSEVYSTPTMANSVDNENTYITTLSANTYVKTGQWAPPWQQIRWMSGGSVQSGYVLEANLIRCTSEVYLGEDTGSIPVSELDPNHDEMVKNNPVHEIAPSLMETRPEDYQSVKYTEATSITEQAIRNATTEQEKWELSCPKKTTAAETVYKINTDVDEVLMTIPAGTYFKITDSSLDCQVIEFMIDGTKYVGKIGLGNTADTMTQVTGTDGLPDNVHELDPRYNAIVSGEWKAKDTSAQGTTVKLENLGTVTSKVQVDGETVEVKTADLVFSEDVPDDKKVAVIYAPRTSKVTMRADASEKADVVKKCKAGTVVSVLQIGKKFSMINYDGTVGYVSNACLQFHDPAQEAQGSATLSYKGKTNGSTTVNIRNKPDKGSAKVVVWKTGTEVTIFSHEDGWYEVEADGVRGFVMEEYVTAAE